MNLRKAFATTLTLIILATFVELSSGASVPSFKELALRSISERQGVSIEYLSILNEGEAAFPLIGQKLWAVKILDAKAMKIYGVYIDADGNRVDIDKIKALEKEQYAKKYGKLEKTLFNHLQTISPDESIEVAIWLTSSSTGLSRSGTFTEGEYREFLLSKEKAYAIAQEPIVDFITARGFQVTYRSRYAPLIFAKLPKSMITELQSKLDVDMIYLSGKAKAELDTIVPTVRANAVWNQGINGAGIKVAVVEAPKHYPDILGKIEFENPYLNGSLYWPEDPSTSSDHATAVAGIIQSTHTSFRGIAYGVLGILNGNAKDESSAELISATEWAISNGARIVNYSWGDRNHTSLELGPLDRYVDHLVWDNRVTMVKSAGNNPNNSGNVTSPGLGYNIITVGAINDMDNELWSDDGMAALSSWKNPISTHGDREKPEVVAVGVGVYSTTTYPPWVMPKDGALSGTSFSAPQVAAGAALLMQANASLQLRPETVKAVLMASAVHNVEGDSRLSEKDGAGAIDLWTAYQTVKSGRIGWWNLTASNFPKIVEFTATKGQRVRVAIVWDSHPEKGHPPATDPLESDLSLIITDPDGNVVAYSTSWDNSYEIVDFLALKDGAYKAQTTASRFDGSYEYVGFAYSISPVWIREWYDVDYNGTTYTFTNYVGTTTVDNLYFANDWGNGTIAHNRSDYIGFRSFASIHITNSTSFSIVITTNDGVRFWVNEELLLNKWFRQNATHYHVTFTTGSNRTYNLRLEWFEWNGTAVIKFNSNLPPSTPSAPSGPSIGYVYTTHTYSTNTSDPNGDNIQYEFSWGDDTGTTTGWYASGATASASHSWIRPGTYQVKVRAQDGGGAWSTWSSNLTVSISQNDAGSHVDAGNSFNAATSIDPGSYKGTLYLANPDDKQDWYKFYAQSGKHIFVSMTPPASVDFDLQLYDPSQNLRATSQKGPGQTESIDFVADLTGYWRIKIYIYNNSGEGQYSFYLSFPSGACPYLYVYSGRGYVSEGLLDIHNPNGTDVVKEHTLIATPKPVKGAYQLRLVEHPQTHSYVDQVKFYAILEDKTTIELPLISAVHSEYGDVLPQLLFSDDSKTDMLGANLNNGTSQSIDLKFLAQAEDMKVIGFLFVIEGNNTSTKE